jgi:Transcriptional regulator
MELRSVRYFIAVAEELHFGKAAERVRIAQPALSIQIKSLEQELGGKLFERDKRNVELTEAGRLFLMEARRIVCQAEHAVKTAKRAFRGEIGSLRIAYTGNAAFSGILGTVLRHHRQHHQGVEITLEEMDSRAQLQGLAEGKYDVAFLPMLSITPSFGIETVSLDSWPLMLGMADNHLLAKSKSVAIAKVRLEPFIVYSSGTIGDGVYMIRNIGDFEPIVAYETKNLNLMMTLIGSGMGVGMLPESLIDVASHHGVTLRPFAGMNLQLDCSFAYRQDEVEPSVLQFIESVKAIFSSGKHEHSMAQAL